MEPDKAHLNLILLGKVRAGKSASGNTILGRQAFVTNESSFSVTQDVAVQSGNAFGFPVTVYDMPGLYETEISVNEMQLQYQKAVQRPRSGPCMFLLVIKTDRFTEGDRRTVEKIEEFLGPHCLSNTWILFTGGDQLERRNTTIQEFLERNNALKTLEKYNQRYHVFNNQKKGTSDQTRLLLAKMIQTSCVLNASEGGMLPRRITTVTTFTFGVRSLSSRRIVLLGKTGVGKSAAGNTILGQEKFRSERGTISVTSECSEAHATVSGRSVSVVDTPGLIDTEMNPEELKIEIARSVYLSSPGPHAFLIVFRADDRFTEHEQQIPEIIEMMFGQEVLRYSIILFTHGDLLEGKPIEKLIEESSRLRHLVGQCGGRYHIFNNKNQNNREQVNDLLQKIDTMIEQNGGGHYSNEMFEYAERKKQEEEKRRQREEEQKKQEKQRREIEKLKKDIEDRIRAEYECQRLELEKAERQREEDQRKQQVDIERVRIQMQNIRTEYEAQRSELESLKAERQREEEWRKQQEIERVRKEKSGTIQKAQSNLEFEQFYRQYEHRFNFSAFAIGKSHFTGIGAILGGVLGAAVGAIAGPAGVAAGGAVGGAFGAVTGAAFRRLYK